MEDLETFLTTLKKGQTWMESMLDIGTTGYELREPKKIANEICKRKDFEHNAKQYLKDVPELSELIKPGINDTKLKLKSKLSDIVLLGKEIIGSHKIDFDKTISNFKQDIQEISKDIEIIREELSLMKLKEYEIKRDTNIPNTKTPCNEPAMVIRSKSSSKTSFTSEFSYTTKDIEKGFETLIIHDLKNSKWNMNVEYPKYLSISEDFIFFDKDIPRKCFWNRSQTSINLIRKLSSELKEGSLNNLLLNSERSIRNINDMIRFRSYSDSLIIRELFEALTRKKIPSRRSKEFEIRSESLQVEESEATIKTEVCNPRENEDLEVECNRRTSEIGFEIGSKIHFDNCEQKPFHTPTSITVQEVTDLLFTLSNILDKIPDSLKHSKMLDLNPPNSMKNAISLLAHLSKSIDMVQLSRSFSFDDTDEKKESNQNMANLERKLGQYSMHCAYKYRVSCNEEQHLVSGD